jgi:mRNA-degrading endonuclease toxin of MazEF toxin-antitoxin module
VTERVPARGAVWLADPAPTAGHARPGRRPGLVGSADRLARAAAGTRPRAIVVPFTTRARGVGPPGRAPPPAGGLRRPSVLLPEHVSAFDRRRRRGRWGRVAEATLLQVADRRRVVLDR